eukprot:TRINITY_DN8241_c0_g1_i1.p2 TRINITY_DN8241_c0_g1~~TRINITY_DN8241_c0_g1_i1.p2  ORF type:complete len:158 (-),score=34.61 TRINITY_DN8241_c0_g1_i1:65-538(-)
MCIRDRYQRRVHGKSIEKAKENKYKAIIIYGHPHNYCKYGFKSSKDFNISNREGKYPYSMLVLELEKDVFKDHSWKYYDSDAYNMDEKKVEEFDKLFTNKEKGYRYTQEEFSIAFRAYLEQGLSLIHISEPTRLGMISYAVFCLKKKKNKEMTLLNM